MKTKLMAVALLALAGSAVASVTWQDGPWDLYKGTAKVSSHADKGKCLSAANATNVTQKLYCKTSTTVNVVAAPVTPPPPPVVEPPVVVPPVVTPPAEPPPPVGGSDKITLSVVPSRVSGVAPLAVFFDATGSTSTLTAKPFHHVEYRWNFGDAQAGNWTAGAPGTNKSKNFATGPVASHVFDKPGTYTVSLSGIYGSDAATKQVTITVADPEVVFAGKTSCISTSGNFTGCPAGAAQITSSSASMIAAAGTRYLFRGGEVFNLTSPFNITAAGPGIVGSYGTGKAVFNLSGNIGAFRISSRTTPTVSDWRVQDIEIRGNNFDNATGFYADGSASNMLFYGVIVRNVKFGWSFSSSTTDLLTRDGFPSPIWDGLFVVGSEIRGLVPTQGNGGNGMYLCGRRLAIMGNYVDTDRGSEHGIRTCFTDRGVYAHNTIEDITSGRAFLSIRAPDQGSVSIGSGTIYTEKVEVSDNYFFGGITTGMSGTGPTNGTSTGRVRNQIWERNFFLGSATTNEALGLAGVDITARNNIFVLQGGNAIGSAPLANSPVPTGLEIYNNSQFGGRMFSIIQNEEGNMTQSVFAIRNNFGEGITNLVGAQIQASNNQIGSYVSAAPAAPTDLTPRATVTGAAVPVWSDYFGKARTANTLGAIAN